MKKIKDLYIIPNYGNWEEIEKFVETFDGAIQIKNPDCPTGSYDSGFRGCDVPWIMKIKFDNKTKYDLFIKEIQSIKTYDDYWFRKSAEKLRS